MFSYLNKYDFEIIGISGGKSRLHPMRYHDPDRKLTSDAVCLDPISRQHKFVQNHNLNHVVLSDTSGEARRAFGVSKVLGFIPGKFVSSRRMGSG